MNHRLSSMRYPFGSHISAREYVSRTLGPILCWSYPLDAGGASSLIKGVGPVHVSSPSRARKARGVSTSMPMLFR